MYSEISIQKISPKTEQSKTGKMLFLGVLDFICVIFFLEFFMFSLKFGSNEVMKLVFNSFYWANSKSYIALKIRKLSRGKIGSELICKI